MKMGRYESTEGRNGRVMSRRDVIDERLALSLNIDFVRREGRIWTLPQSWGGQVGRKRIVSVGEYGAVEVIIRGKRRADGDSAGTVRRIWEAYHVGSGYG